MSAPSSEAPDALLRAAQGARDGLRARPPLARLEPTGPGEESVWDYPRPPRVEAVDALVEVRLGGAPVAATRLALRVCETASPPVYYLPREAFTGVILVDLDPSDGSLCEWKGWATYLDVIVGGARAATGTGRRMRRAAWTYAPPIDDLGQGYGRLSGHVAVYPAQFECFVDGVRAEPQPGGFYGGWVLPTLRGPWKGGPGTHGW